MTRLTQEDLVALSRGAAVLGTGGGGDPQAMRNKAATAAAASGFLFGMFLLGPGVAQSAPAVGGDSISPKG